MDERSHRGLSKRVMSNEHNSHPLVLVLDGGISTHLESMQLSASFPDRNLWSSSLLMIESGRSDIQKAHEDFYAAGSHIVTSVTYQLSHFAENHGYDKVEIDTMLETAIHLANEAKHKYSSSISSNDHDNDNEINMSSRYVIASAGCYGAAQADGSEYTGDYNLLSIDQLMTFHRARVQILSKQNIDGIAFETIPALAEVKAVVQLVKELVISGECKGFIWITLACRDCRTLNDGTPVQVVMQAIHKLDPDGEYVHGIGVNCCKVKYVHDLAAIIARYELASTRRRRAIVLYPNSGEEWDAENKSWLEESGCADTNGNGAHAHDFTMEMMKCVRMIHGLCIESNNPFLPIFVGGCCRTTPSTIKALRAAVDEYIDNF
eukprot:scaffold1987_cov236-Chaetoceros_neogracile.AAC.3